MVQLWEGQLPLCLFKLSVVYWLQVSPEATAACRQLELKVDAAISPNIFSRTNRGAVEIWLICFLEPR